MVIDSEANFIQCYLAQAPYASQVASLAKQHVNLNLFESIHCRNIMDCIIKYQRKEDGVPTRQMLEVMLSQIVKNPEHLKKSVDFLRTCEKFEITDWHLTECEKWVRERSTMVAICEAIEQVEKKNLTGITEKMSLASTIRFDNSVGMSFSNDWVSRFNARATSADLVPSGIDWIDKISRGGLPRKSLTCFLSTHTGGFKSGTMTHMACQMYLKGLNVLYVTFELSEIAIGERIDAHLLDIEIDNLGTLTRDQYESGINRVTSGTKGSITIKEFANGGADAATIDLVIKELIAKGQRPDVLIVDYLNIMASSRLPASESGNSYHYVKSIAEELRALAQVRNLVCITATQSNRSGLKAGKDIGIESTSESHGVPSTLDLYIAIITNEELEAASKLMYSQLKNRRREIGKDKKWVARVNKAKMRLYDDTPRLKL